MLVAAEISAASVVIQYWTTQVNVAVWITIMLAGTCFVKPGSDLSRGFDQLTIHSMHYSERLRRFLVW